MAKVQVYLPDALRARIRAKLPDLNVSAVLQQALEEKLAELGRKKALDAAIRSYEREFGRITAADVDAAHARERATARRPNAPGARPARPKERPVSAPHSGRPKRRAA